MNLSRFGAVLIGSADPMLRGIRVQHTLVAIALGAAGTSVEGGVLDFESLQYPTTFLDQIGGIDVDPFELHMGFKFSSENFYPPALNHPFANVWYDYALTDTPSYNHGFVHGINGARALGTPIYAVASLSTFSIEREDGGEWMFGGAQFTRVNFPYSGTYRLVGLHGNDTVYDINTTLSATAQLFYGAQVDAIAVDRVVMTYRWTSSVGNVFSMPFIMDDMHYELVPAPGALVLLSMCGLLRQRRRD